jgi:type VI secretion system secreted protein Hcp
MAMDQFLVFSSADDIKGETKDKTFKSKNGIDILAWSWGLSNSGSAHMGTGQGSGKASFQDISITKYLDLSSSKLMYSAATGKHLKEADIIVRKAGEHPLEYLTIKLKDILISSYSTGGSGGEDRLTENVTLNFAIVELEYKTQDETGKAGKDKGNFSYDIAANAKD